MNDEAGRHLYIEDIVPLVSAATGISQRQTRRTLNAFCNVLGDQLGQGNNVTLRGVGRFRVVTIKSYWRTDLQGRRIAQRGFRKIYFTASNAVQQTLNKHLKAGGKRAKGKADP